MERPLGRCAWTQTALALIVAALAGGCGPAAGTGELTALSLGERPVLLGERCVTAVYGRPGAETSFYLSSVPEADLLSGRISEGVVVHIDLLWQPKAGATPMEPTATNVSIHYIVFAGGQVGVYGGSGFALPRGTLGGPHFGLSLKEASLTLLVSTDGFVDLLSPARLTGALTAAYDEEQTRRVRRAVSQIVTNAMGKSMFVRRPASSPGGSHVDSSRRTLHSRRDPGTHAGLLPALSMAPCGVLAFGLWSAGLRPAGPASCGPPSRKDARRRPRRRGWHAYSSRPHLHSRRDPATHAGLLPALSMAPCGVLASGLWSAGLRPAGPASCGPPTRKDARRRPRRRGTHINSPRLHPGPFS